MKKFPQTIHTPVPIQIEPAQSEIDRINNIDQKEKQMARAGVTRYKYLLVIAEALEAVKVGDVFHENGDVTHGPIPDVARRQWGAEQAAKLHGDMIERKEIEHDLGDKTLDKLKTLSVAELKERAKAILRGQPVKRIDIEANEIS